MLSTQNLLAERASSFQYALMCPPRVHFYDPIRSGCRLTISPGNVTASVNITSHDEEITLALQPGETFTQIMSLNYQTGNGIQDKGVLVITDTALYIVVELLDNYYNPPVYIDSTQILPLPSSSPSQYKYYLASWKSGALFPASMHTQFYSIAAGSEETRMEIYGGLTVTLLPGQTYTYVVDGSNAVFDPTGKLVTSNRSVSIISGALSEKDKSSVITFIRPIGSQHYVAPHMGNSANTGYSLRIIAMETNTHVQVDGDDYTIDEDDQFVHLDFPNRHNISIVGCDRTCSAYIITKSWRNVVGVTLLSIIPTNEFYTSAYFVTADYDFPHFLSLVLEGGSPHYDISLDGQSLAGQAWENSSGFSYVWMEIEKGSHWLQSAEERGFAAYVYGHSGYWDGGYGHSIWPGE